MKGQLQILLEVGPWPKNPCKGRRELHYGAANGQRRSPELEVQGERDQVDNEMMFQEHHNHQGDGDALIRQPVGLPAGMGNGLGMPSSYQVATPREMVNVHQAILRTCTECPMEYGAKASFPVGFP